MESILIVSPRGKDKESICEYAKSEIKHILTLGEIISCVLADVAKDNVLVQGYTKDSANSVKCINTNSLTTLFMNEDWENIHFILGDGLLSYIISTYFVIFACHIENRFLKD